MSTPLPPFQTLLDRHAEDVLRYLIAAIGSDRADDCFQETFLAALRGYPDLTDASNLGGWLLTIARRKALDNRRIQSREAIPAGRSDDLPGATHNFDDDPLDAAALWEAVDELPPKQKAAVRLRFTEDLSHREIATVLGCSEPASRRSLHEGIAKLAEVWS